MGRRYGANRNTPVRDEVEVFPTGSTLARQRGSPSATDVVQLDPSQVDVATPPWDAPLAPSLADRFRHGGELVRDGIGHARDFQARPGRRPGAPPVLAGTTSNRVGGDTDIVRPVLVPPVFASEFAVTGGLFAEPIPHLSIHQSDHHTAQRLLMWDGELDSGGHRRRVTFHLLASPSMVVTVLELIPCRRVRRRRPRERFLADGVAAVEALARRLEHASASR
jgi:hypothetical protein